MGVHPNISADKWPKQGDMLGKPVLVIFQYNVRRRLSAVCVRDDTEDPYRTLFRLNDGRIVDGSECQWRPKE